MKNKITLETVFRSGSYEIVYSTDNLGHWAYTLLKNGVFRIQSYDFNRLKEIAITDRAYLAN